MAYVDGKFPRYFFAVYRRVNSVFQLSTPSSEEKAYPLIPNCPFPPPRTLTVYIPYQDDSAILERSPSYTSRPLLNPQNLVQKWKDC